MSAPWEIKQGDMREALASLEPDSVHACVTDPPYELGFMGKGWDSSGVAFSPETWRAVYRVLKPGGHLLAFGGSRTYHRIACAIEDAGFELRDTLMWIYGSGFPKSLNVSKAIDKALGCERTKVRHRARAVTSGTMAANADSRPWIEASRARGYHEAASDEAASDEAATWQGWGTALKPAFEPIILARKPLGSTVAACVLANGTGALNVDACRVGSDDGYTENAVTQGVNTARTSYAVAANRMTFEPSTLGRWPANVLHDGSDEVTALLGKAARFFYHGKASVADREAGCGELEVGTLDRTRPDGGEATGLNADPKLAPRQRRNTHVTVKPTSVMEWLVRLVTPPGGLVLDPFAGSGSTGIAAARSGFSFLGVELDESHIKIARARVGWAYGKETR